MLSHNLKEKGVRVILSLKQLEEFEPIDLIGVLNTIRKEIGLLRGDLKLCSPSPALLKYLRENRLDRIFQIYETEQTAKNSRWRNHANR
jgi:anti-anti-sigma regulatory factor